MPKLILKIFLISITSFVLISCSLFDIGNNKNASISFEAQNRAILPEGSDFNSVTSFQFLGEGPDGATFASEKISKNTYIAKELAPGDWVVTIKGFNTNGHLIAQDIASVKLIADSVYSHKVSLNKIDGDGTLSIVINWKNSQDYDNILGKLTDSNGNIKNLTFTVGSLQASYTSPQKAGDYQVEISLKKADLLIDTIVEKVEIYSGFTSAATYNKSIERLEFNYDSATPVFEMKTTETTANVLINNAEGKELFLVKSNPTTNSVNGASTGSASNSLDIISYNKSLMEDSSSTLSKITGQIIKYDHIGATLFNANPIPFTQKNSPSFSMLKTNSIVYGPSAGLTEDISEKKFWVQNASGQWVEINTTLRAIGHYCYIWVADSDYNNSSTLENDNKLNSSQISNLRDKFDGTSANVYKDGIFENVTNIFGYEYGGGPGGDGGKDGDQHIEILIYDIDYDYTADQKGGILGYFWGKDFYDQADLDAYNLKTNKSEIFYIDTHFTDYMPNIILSTLAHEFQHMIHFNQKAIEHNVLSETWFDEMSSMVAEDLVLANIGLDPVEYGAQDRIPAYLYHYAESGISDWLSNNDVLKSYASAFAFGAFLSRNYGGAQLFKAIMESDQSNELAINYALQSLGYTDTMNDVLKKYSESLVYNSTPLGSNIKTFNSPQSSEIDGITYGLLPINFANIEQVNYSYGKTGVKGIRTYLPSSGVELRPYGNSVHTKESWKSLTSAASITLININPNIKYYLMVK